MTREFKSVRSFFTFKNTVKTRFRHVLDSESSDFVETVAETSHSREKTLSQGKEFYRARLGCQDLGYDVNGSRNIAPYEEEGLRPRKDGAVEGRANPKGIPVFYCELECPTAIGEMRPPQGAHVSWGRFYARRDLRLVDCAAFDECPTFEELLTFLNIEPDAREKERVVWCQISAAFSEPVARQDDSADYIPTQILAEVFKREGFDGIIYRSAMCPNGNNVVICDLKDLVFIKSGLVKVNKVSLDLADIIDDHS